MTETVILGGVTWHKTRYTRIDQPYSMVLDWCDDRFGPGHKWPIGFHDPAERMSWGHDGGNFYFSNPDDRMLFVLRWL